MQIFEEERAASFIGEKEAELGEVGVAAGVGARHGFQKR